MSWTSTYEESGFDAIIETLEAMDRKVQVYDYGIQARDYSDYPLRCALVTFGDEQYVLTEVYYESIYSEFGDGDWTPMGVLTERISKVDCLSHKRSM